LRQEGGKALVAAMGRRDGERGGFSINIVALLDEVAGATQAAKAPLRKPILK